MWSEPPGQSRGCLTFSEGKEADVRLPGDTLGERFGRYQLLRRLGTGGMAEVFAAQTFGAEGFVKDLVIKRILPVFGQDPEFVRMFINEARLAACLQHANIVQIFDFNHVDGIYFIAMEWVDGLDLRSLLAAARRRALPLPLRMAVHVGAETLKGLHYAHTKSDGGRALGLVHRDISPHNLLVSFAGEVKITDFGIAKAAALASVTRTGAIKGKLAYMSPEQVTSSPVDARSDLFALGVVLWELLAGQRLYQADSEGELFAKVRRAEVPPLNPLNPEVSAELEQVLRRLLAPRPEDRYPTAAEALGELGRFAEVDGALQVASYLRRLLPAEAAREKRGETEVQPQLALEAGTAAGPAAPTRTRLAPGQEAGSLVSTLARPPALQSTPLPARVPDPSDRQGPRWARGWRAALICWICFGLFAAASYLLAGRGRPTAKLAGLLVQTGPPGAELWADDLPLGPAPLRLEGPPGERLRLRARWSGPPAVEVESSIVMGTASSIMIGSPPRHRLGRPGTTAPATAPAAASAPAAPRPAGESASGRPRPPAGASRPVTRPAAHRIRAPERTATLDVLVAPWARVRVDGRDGGQTPIKGLRLPAGSHLVEISNPELGQRERVKLKLSPDQHTVIRRRWIP